MSQESEIEVIAETYGRVMDTRTPEPPVARMGILVRDPLQRRLLDGVALQLELVVEEIATTDMRSTDYSRYEIVVVDREDAEALQLHFAAANEGLEGVHPSIVTFVRATDPPVDLLQEIRPGDGPILLPQVPAQLLAQLSVVLYAHRAFARRYQTALEELQLNRRIFRSVTSGISVADATLPDLPLTYVNPAFEVMSGYSLEEVAGCNCRFLQRDDREQPALTILREAIQAERQVTVVLRNYRKDGSCFWNELSMAPIRSRDGKLTHFVGIQNDVTARVEFEAALRESEKLAAVGRLAASIAHEINNPLESVMNLLYLAEKEDELGKAKHYITEAETEVKRIALITTQSLRFYRQNTKAQPADLDNLLSEVIDLYSPKLFRFQITVQHDRAVHDHVVCMDSEIRQVLSNLVRNAIDAMRVHGGRLVTRTRVMREYRTDQLGVAVTIADTGTGIPPDVQKKLYTAFFTTKGDVGTGLGLWVSANIVERHKGRLLMRSSSKPHRHGTVFTVFLPFDSDVIASQ